MVVKSLRVSRYQMCRRIYYTTSRCIASSTHPIFFSGVMLILFEYYNRTKYVRLLIVSLQKLIVVDRGESFPSLCFHIRPDCILCEFRLIRPSLFAHTRAVDEGKSYPNHNGLRFFTRGLPNLKRYYGERGHYPAYYMSFQHVSRSLSSKGFPEHYKVCRICYHKH